MNEKLSHLNTDNNNLKNLTSSKIVFPLFEISELSCRFKDFSTLSNDCKIIIPTLISKYHQKYLTKNKGYNDITRIYTILWWASYWKWWDTWKWGHLGLDIATSKWTPVYAIADGEVIIAKTDLALWKIITIKHNINWNILFSNYWHLSEIFIKKWDKVNVGNKIWEVWSTGNSNWNHLHFQIDKDTPFHPYYYDYNKCPHSYFDIMEKGICFDELKKNTIDPIVFFEKYWTNINLYTDL